MPQETPWTRRVPCARAPRRFLIPRNTRPRPRRAKPPLSRNHSGPPACFKFLPSRAAPRPRRAPGAEWSRKSKHRAPRRPQGTPFVCGRPRPPAWARAARDPPAHRPPLTSPPQPGSGRPRRARRRRGRRPRLSPPVWLSHRTLTRRGAHAPSARLFHTIKHSRPKRNPNGGCSGPARRPPRSRRPRRGRGGPRAGRARAPLPKPEQRRRPPAARGGARPEPREGPRPPAATRASRGGGAARGRMTNHCRNRVNTQSRLRRALAALAAARATYHPPRGPKACAHASPHQTHAARSPPPRGAAARRPGPAAGRRHCLPGPQSVLPNSMARAGVLLAPAAHPPSGLR